MHKWAAIIVLSAFFWFIQSSNGFTLTIDTNELLNAKPEVTNISTKKVVEPDLPNSYLSTGKIDVDTSETIGRRFDLLYFIAIPVSFYLTQNVMQLKNIYFNNNAALDRTDWNFIYFNTLFIPLSIAYFDYLHVQKLKRQREELAMRKPIQDRFCFDFQVVALQF